MLVSDCKLGLACVTQPDQTRKCSSDLSGIVSVEEGDAAPPRSTYDAGQVAKAGQVAEAGQVVEAAVLPLGDDSGSETGAGAVDDAAAQE